MEEQSSSDVFEFWKKREHPVEHKTAIRPKRPLLPPQVKVKPSLTAVSTGNNYSPAELSQTQARKQPLAKSLTDPINRSLRPHRSSLNDSVQPSRSRINDSRSPRGSFNDYRSSQGSANSSIKSSRSSFNDSRSSQGSVSDSRSLLHSSISDSRSSRGSISDSRSSHGSVSELAKVLGAAITQSQSMTRLVPPSPPNKEEMSKSLGGRGYQRTGLPRPASWTTERRESKTGFTCYLDGPPEATPTPPTSPLQEVSELARITTVLKEENFVPGPWETSEEAQFWKRVGELAKGPCPKRVLLAPVLSLPQNSPPLSKMYGTVSSSQSPRDLAAEVSWTGSRTVLPCSSSTIVRVLISRALKEFGAPPSDHTHLLVKVCGREEYLQSDLSLGQHYYVNQCQKLHTTIKLVLVDKSHDKVDHTPKPSDASDLQSCVSQEEANDLLNSYKAKELRFISVLESRSEVASSPVSMPALAQSVISCVSLLCERLGFIQTPAMIEAVYNLRRACKTATQLEIDSLFSPSESCVIPVPDNDPWIAIPDGSYVVGEEHVQDILMALDVLRSTVCDLVSLYCKVFTPGYTPKWVESGRSHSQDITKSSGSLRIKVESLYRVNTADIMRFTSLQVEVSVYYGGQSLSKRAYSPHAKPSRDFFDCVVWDKWLNMGVELHTLLPESRALFTVYGVEVGPDSTHNRTPLAWAALRLFTQDRELVGGAQLLGLWTDSEPDPLDSMYSDLYNRQSMLLQVCLEDHRLCFPSTLPERLSTRRPAPPPNITRTLQAIGNRTRFENLSPDEMTLVWSNRMFCPELLSRCSRGLPTVVQSAPSLTVTELGDLWTLTGKWHASDPAHGLELLGSEYADKVIRGRGVEWVECLSDDDLCDLLPQLVQSLRYESWLDCDMTRLLLSRTLSSPRITHYLFWILTVSRSCDPRSEHRHAHLMRALNRLANSEITRQLQIQVDLVGRLRAVAMAVKGSKVAQRQTTLVHGLQEVSEKLIGRFSLPLSPAMVSMGISIENCSYFNSNTVPLRVSFTNFDPLGENIQLMYKVGDDLRQDILVLQMIREMEKVWLRAGLDLRMITYQCMATGCDEGFIELVGGAETLRTIQTEHGLTGSFRDKPLSDWLMRHNTTESSYQQAVENFTLSCAGYCVATFVLGICDRHNDNIMLTKGGHMFHIDFGRILGNAQMFGSIKRDRAPFVLTRDMAYVINGGDTPTTNFQKFTDLCCAAYNELRKHSALLISLLSLMLHSGLPELNSTEDVQYVSDALLPGRSEAEATFTFTRYIEDSLASLATPVNFFIHNLAQYKFGSGETTPSLLSFSPQAYSIATDCRATNAVVIATHKRFHPDTHYIYEIEVYRDNSADRSTIFRRYREFNELHRKLVQCFPDESLPAIPGKIFTPGRSNTKETSESRKVLLNEYLASLLEAPPTVGQSDVVYTFLHCLIRDQQEAKRIRKEERGQKSPGKVKLEISYKSKQQSLSVIVRHVKDLVPRDGQETADPYVKIYLLPDHQKTSKQKTKVAKRTLNPTYNHQFMYVIPVSGLSGRVLQVSVWDAGGLSKHCLCQDTLALAELRKSLLQGNTVAQWFELTDGGHGATVWHSN